MSRAYTLRLDPSLAPSPALVALVWAEEIEPPTPPVALPDFVGEILARVKAKGEDFVPDSVRMRVRRMLRYGKYKPSGRGKPASEFLLRAALADSFPLINGPVDVNNAVSLESGFPGSVFDADLTGPDLLVRRGDDAESYVFNPSGQTIDLTDLLLVCRQTTSGWEPCGNPVKDSMATKTSETTRTILGVLYVPADEPADRAEQWAARYAELLQSHCGARNSGYEVVDQTESRPAPATQ